MGTARVLLLAAATVVAGGYLVHVANGAEGVPVYLAGVLVGLAVAALALAAWPSEADR